MTDERQPVQPEALEHKEDKSQEQAATTKGGDQAVPVQDTEGEKVVTVPVGKKKGVKGDVATGGKGTAGGEPPGPAGQGDLDQPQLDYTIPESDTANGQSRPRAVRIRLDQLTLAVQAELQALLDARRTMTWHQRELTRLALKELTEVLVALQDQRAAHHLIERYMEIIASDPAHAQKLPGMKAFKKVAGAMANAEKASKGDGRKQAEKGKKAGEAQLDDLLKDSG